MFLEVICTRPSIPSACRGDRLSAFSRRASSLLPTDFVGGSGVLWVVAISTSLIHESAAVRCPHVPPCHSPQPHSPSIARPLRRPPPWPPQ
eukprot:872005-Pleurochrysis_carterae.AAC.2